VVVLAAAVLGARALVNAPIVVPPVEVSAAPVVSVAPTPLRVVSSAPLVARVPTDVAPPPRPPPPPREQPFIEVPAPRPAVESPFANENSAAVADAFRQVVGPTATPQTARQAISFFEQCLREAPGNRRCAEGLTAAKERADQANPDQLTPPPQVPRIPAAMLRDGAIKRLGTRRDVTPE
jgi:hypothetical protein